MSSPFACIELVTLSDFYQFKCTENVGDLIQFLTELGSSQPWTGVGPPKYPKKRGTHISSK